MRKVYEVKTEDLTLEIYNDEHAKTPREWDNLGTMVCGHKRYDLGDAQATGKEGSWQGEIEHQVEEPEKAVILPLYLYDHSQLAMDTKSFVGRAHHAEWDSGEIGFIYATYEDIKEWFMTDEITEDILELTRKMLKGEVKTYNNYLQGKVYGFELFKKEACEHCGHTEKELIDSCFGFYGNEFESNGLMEHAGDMISMEQAQKLFNNLDFA